MLNIAQFIAENVTFRASSMFAPDIEANKEELSRRIAGKKVLVIGGAGSIGSSYIRALLPFKPAKLVVVDLNENGLTELTRDLRSTYGMFVPEDYRTYPISFADPVFEKIFRAENGFEIVANFSAHKHVRSEKDVYSVEALINNNVLRARKLLDLLTEFQIRTVHVTCPLEVLLQRELARGNRCIGSAEASYTYLYPQDGYDLTVDNAARSPEENAAEIFQQLLK